MNKILLINKILFLYLLFFYGCETNISDSSNNCDSNSTVSCEEIGNGNETSLLEYFYTLNEHFDVQFHRFGLPLSINNPALWSEEDTLNYTNYTDLVLTIDPENVENYTTVETFDETGSGTCCDNVLGCTFFTLTSDNGKCIGGVNHGNACSENSDCYGTCRMGDCTDGDWDSFEECCTNNDGTWSFNDNTLEGSCDGYAGWTASSLDDNANGVYEASEYREESCSDGVSADQVSCEAASEIWTDACIDINQDGLLGKSRYFDIPHKEEVIIRSSTYTNLDNLIWDTFDKKNRYTPTISSTLSYQDYTFDLAIEPEVKDISDASECPEGTVFNDSSESFNFCDLGNGEYDQGEDFDDSDGDLAYSSGEVFYDVGDGAWNDVSDPYDSTTFFVQVDPALDVVGLSYFDPSEYIQKDTTYISDYLSFEREFTLSRKVIVDSLMYRISTDCNINGTWDNTKENRYVFEYGSYGDEISCTDESEDYIWGLPWDDTDLSDICFEYYDEEGCLAADDSYSWQDSDNTDYDGICFTDLGNGIWDDAEVFLDLNNSSDCDCDRAGTDIVEEDEEPFEDRNCNGAWDGAEVIVESGLCASGTFTSVDGIDFCDFGNRIWDDVEIFDDSNGDSSWDCTDADLDGDIDIDECEGLFRMNSSPNILVVDYSDENDPVPLEQIDMFQDVVTRIGLAYSLDEDGNAIQFPDFVDEDGDPVSVPDQYYYFENILDEITIVDAKVVNVDKIDSVHTTFSNDIIDMSELSSSGQEFSITKVQTEKANDSNAALIDREYYYLIFKYDSGNNLVQLKHPSYFYPIDPNSTEGFYSTEQALSDGFWFSEFPKLDTYFYTYYGLLRDGEYVTSQETVSTSVADYFVERYDSTSYVGSFSLENVRTEDDPETLDEDESGNKIRYEDVYKIQRTIFYTMIGTGLEFGERNTTWLAPGVGIIRDLIEIHWIDPFWETESPDYALTDDEWIDISLIELQRYGDTPSPSGSSLARIFSQHSTVNSLDKFQYLPELDYEKYIKKHTLGLQSYRLNGN